jgi:hypothetical protein
VSASRRTHKLCFVSVKVEARLASPEERAALEMRLAAASRRARTANALLYFGLLVGGVGFGAYLAAAPMPSWWVAALILLLPFLTGIGLARQVIRG